ncbi:unnamed protein product [Spodoptera exigua]|nr:unnamed protein product [Spodoptera exigua]
MKLQVRSLRKTKNGGVIISTESKGDIEKLRQSTQLSSSGLSVDEPKKRNPRVVIIGVPSTMPDNEALTCLYHQNLAEKLENCSLDSFLSATKMSHKSGRRDAATCNFVIEVTAATRKALMSQERVFINWSSCPVRDFTLVTRCYKCQQYGHAAKSCRQTSFTCSHCGEQGHTIKDFTKKSDEPKCATCLHFKKPANHTTGATECPAKTMAEQSGGPEVRMSIIVHEDAGSKPGEYQYDTNDICLIKAKPGTNVVASETLLRLPLCKLASIAQGDAKVELMTALGYEDDDSIGTTTLRRITDVVDDSDINKQTQMIIVTAAHFKLGLNTIFNTTSSGLEGILRNSNKSIALNKIKQKLFVQIDEVGVARFIHFENMGPPQAQESYFENSPQFTADRPFYFDISLDFDNARYEMFTGVYYGPEETASANEMQIKASK